MALWVFASTALADPVDLRDTLYGTVLLLVALPVLTAGCLLTTVFLVLPVLFLAERVGRVSWSWILLFSLVLAAGPFGPWLSFRGGPWFSVGCWLAAGGSLAAAGLAARAARRRVRTEGAWRALGRALLRGLPAVPAALVVGLAAHLAARGAGLA
ncbi:hypothetical protein [Streptomyces qinglanensis]|uniref:hypothetical protein n=1 Tax=Streptomyces qinglanensis TaxID=943816 RepID=UPI001C433EF6|nr:hypothetical protein [Streptomyces qinglanensis]